MVQLWEKLFSRQPISCNDNFFSLGGNSLLAVKLLVRVEGAFGKRLSLASLVAAPTIRQFAAFVRANDPVRRIAQATTIQPQGTKPPFFCVGAGALFHSLVEQMGTDRPFLSLILRKDAIDKLKTPYSLEELAGHLVDAMRERQPNGPYYLGGFCQDGILAYETARQLTLRGQKVAMLFLFETVNPAPLPEDRVASQWRRTAIRLKYRRDQFRQLGASNFPQFFKLQVASARRRLTPVAWRVSHRARKLVGDAKLNSLERIVHIASRTYKPKPLSSPTLLFRCNEWPIASAGDPYFGWRSLLTGWNKTVEIPGNHAGMFRQEGAEQLAKEMKFYMDQAETTNWAEHGKSD
ncbi:MAG: thioesterase domain-containing protein [Candidatus Acidiferrales bacterium]